MQGKLGSVLTLNTNRITVDSRFEISQQPLQEQQEVVAPVLARHASRRRHKQQRRQPLAVVEPAPLAAPPASDNSAVAYHLRIENVQIYDENEYACETSISKQNEDQTLVHSLIYLHVTR